MPRRTAIIGLALAGAIGLSGCGPVQFDVAFFGDVPYSSSAITKYDSMISDINRSGVAFSSHVGDIGPGISATCTNETVDRETRRFDTLAQPLVYTPGDNEWTDCGTGAVQLSRLSYLRQQVFRNTGTESRGQTRMALESQASRGYPENTRWRRGPVTFATLHIVGSNDNVSAAEHGPRRQATIDWLRETFAQARDRGDKGVVLIAQRDPNLTTTVSSAYRSMNEAVRDEVSGFFGQVLFVSGDAHSYTQVNSVAGLSNFRWVRVEGDSLVSYVRTRIDTSTSSLFSISQPKRF
ncbi:MAG: hypothetical protein AVDCRST_MAG20-1530 [uncultured Acidimicrobiales bacterium]|uniref:Calcineurin-like phosphoesterase domain-containing protein n=1 Tax=uncultured Acidimicrobiales bacterium TaxID=310071 RepID=A0A6J4HXR9_9ACTN|nr:MAG: hypothetical protein AVDCRST_MAG20-1530 [uncultured Acidimicrobiales bacterium]